MFALLQCCAVERVKPACLGFPCLGLSTRGSTRTPVSACSTMLLGSEGGRS